MKENAMAFSLNNLGVIIHFIDNISHYYLSMKIHRKYSFFRFLTTKKLLPPNWKQQPLNIPMIILPTQE
ncbi:hypothetical protein I6E26_04530 [Anaerovibrio lipolyticus]|nr:hypothetical protein [Anaerovibrio lipolyticus]